MSTDLVSAISFAISAPTFVTNCSQDIHLAFALLPRQKELGAVILELPQLGPLAWLYMIPTFGVGSNRGKTQHEVPDVAKNAISAI